jgi:hypothetical protein
MRVDRCANLLEHSPDGKPTGECRHERFFKMVLRSALIFSVAVLLPLGAHAQTSQASINQCIQTACAAERSQVSECSTILDSCLAENGNCDHLAIIECPSVAETLDACEAFCK